MYPTPVRVIYPQHVLAQASPAAAPAAAPAASSASVVSGPWYSTMWSAPAVYGVPVVPTILVLGGIAAIVLLAGSRR